MLKDTILVVDDEPSVLSSIFRTLRSEPWEVITELSGEQALCIMRDRPIKVVISDEKMTKMQGAEFLSIVRALYPQTVRILLTGHASIESAIEVINHGGVFRFLTKPWDNERLKRDIRDALGKYDRETKVREILKSFAEKPEMLPHIDRKYPGISQALGNNQTALMLPVLSDSELEEVLELLGSEL